MADEPVQEVLVTFFEHPVKRTEQEIRELRADGLLREQGPVPGLAGTHATADETRPAVVTAPGAPVPPALAPASGKTPPADSKEK